MSAPAKVLAYLEGHPGSTAKAIAAALDLDKKEVNSILYGELAGTVRQDKRYKWWPPSVEIPTSTAAPERPSTPLSRLCEYYLACLARDDLGGVSVWKTSKYDPEYVELDALPEGSSSDGIFEGDEASKLLRSHTTSRKRTELSLGYPVRVRKFRSRRGSEHYKVEPITLVSFETDEQVRVGPPRLSEGAPRLNLEALKYLSSGGATAVMEEALELSDALGLGDPETEVFLDDLGLRMRRCRPDWDWVEDPDPDRIDVDPPLTEATEPGIYNRAIIVLSERSPYTQGLETELASLSRTPMDQVQSTALHLWIEAPEEATKAEETQSSSLLESLPLNSEQRAAVERALTEPLTVITGPPGTGKSQVVSAILQNAAWSGQTVLFASKNHKAVDVVETRVNALGPRPVLMRLGSQDSQERLADYLTALLAARVTPDAEQRYEQAKARYAGLQQDLQSLRSRAHETLELRNHVDRLEQEAEAARKLLGETLFAAPSGVDQAAVEQRLRDLEAIVDRADPMCAGLLGRIFWTLLQSGRQQALRDHADVARELASRLRLPAEATPNRVSVREWRDFLGAVQEQLSALRLAEKYHAALDELVQATSLESIQQEMFDRLEEVAEFSAELWHHWLSLQPSRITPGVRRKVGDYVAVLRSMISGGQNRSWKALYQKYFSSFADISSLLPCWAVTSLSARGRVPFEPGFFDLLVIDEASQCDIASAIPLLFRARRAVIIGDPQQLRHITQVRKWQDQELLEKHDTPQRLSYASMSLFDSAAASVSSPEDIVQLRDHHRSHASIIGFSNEFFYDGNLRVATKYQALALPSDGTAVRWIDVQGRTRRPSGGGAVNDDEANKVISELRRLLLDQEYPGSVGVVSPFRAQVNRVRELLSKDRELSERANHAQVLIDTVHRFQGDERDLMIFSPTVSSGSPSGAVGFLKASPHLFNVAITRARAALLVVGDRGAAGNLGVQYLKSFSDYVESVESEDRRRERFHQPSQTGPEYPDVARPELVSCWEVDFYKALWHAGITPIPQYEEERFILDFALFEDDRKLAIEVDGERYHRDWDGELLRRDQLRNMRLMELGWEVMRFWVYEIRDDMERCVEQVQRWQEGGQ